MGTIQQTLEKHKQENRPAPERLAFVIGFLAGSLAAREAAISATPEEFQQWCEDCKAESAQMISEFDKELSAELTVRREGQHN